MFDLIWETSAASAAQLQSCGKRKFHQNNGKFGELYKLVQEIIDSAFPKTTQMPQKCHSRLNYVKLKGLMRNV